MQNWRRCLLICHPILWIGWWGRIGHLGRLGGIGRLRGVVREREGRGWIDSRILYRRYSRYRSLDVVVVEKSCRIGCCCLGKRVSRRWRLKWSGDEKRRSNLGKQQNRDHDDVDPCLLETNGVLFDNE